MARSEALLEVGDRALQAVLKVHGGLPYFEERGALLQ